MTDLLLNTEAPTVITRLENRSCCHPKLATTIVNLRRHCATGNGYSV